MPKLTPQQAQEKHARNLKASTSDIRAGINRVTTAPGQLAAAKADKMLANLTEAVTSGKWARRVSAVPLAEWKTKAIEKGIPNISRGIDLAAPKMVSFYSQLFPYQESLQAQISGMADLTLQDSIQRMIRWAEGMADFEYT